MQARATAALRKWDHQELTTPSRSQVAVEALASIQHHQVKTDDLNICWPVLIGAFIIQFFVPSVLSSHGVYISHLLVTGRLSFGAALLPPAVFSATWSFVDPWCRRAGLRHRGEDSRLLAGCGVLLLALSLAGSTLIIYSPLRIFSFGIIGGIGCSLAVSQCETQLALHSSPQHTFSLTVSFVAQALGLFLTPLVLVGLLAAFGSVGAPLVHCALVLHGLAGALLFRIAPQPTINNSMSLQLSTYNSLPEDVPLESAVDGRGWRNPSLDTSCVDSFSEEDEDDGDGRGRHRNHMGVEILPPILEEDEPDEGKEQTTFTDSIAQSHSRRRSIRDSWSPNAPLSIYLPITQDSTVKGDSPKPLLTPSSLSGISRNFEFERPDCCVQCKDQVVLSMRKGCSAVSKCVQGLWEPALVPGLMVNSSVRLVALGVVTIAPVLAQHMLHLPRHETAFAVAIIGFGWLCFGVCTPCLLAPSARRHASLIYALASCLSAVGLYMMSQVTSHDRLTLACVLMGMSHGALVLSSPLLLKRLWNNESPSLKTQNFLDHGTGLVIFTIAIIAYFLAESAVSYCFMLIILAGLQACIGLACFVWILIQRIRFRFHMDLQRTWRTSEPCTDWGAGVLHTS